MNDKNKSEADKNKKKKAKKKKPLWKRFSRWFQKSVGPNLGPPIGVWLIRAFSLTMSKKIYGLHPFLEALESDKPVILAFWHGRLLMLPIFYERYIPYEINMLVSLHTDGQIISKTIESFGIYSIRGSSRRGGKAAVLNMIRMLKNGNTVGFTPDGPRGPGEEAKRGTIEVAYAVKAVVFPVTYAASMQKKLWTWDKFVIPFPFSRLVFVVGDPIELSGNETKEEREALLLELSARMTEIGRRAEALARSPEER